MPGAWLILPTYDECENIAAIVAAARAVLERAAPGDHRILIVDDGSPDGTGAIADGLAAEHDDVEVLHRTVREGLGPAYLAGFTVRWTAAPRSSWRWTPTSRMIPPTSRACWPPPARPTSCSARATWPAAA